MAKLILAALHVAILCTKHVATLRVKWRPEEVTGVTLQDPEELDGQKPMFVDAFRDAAETGAYIIFSWVPRTSLTWEWEPSSLHWQCLWSPVESGSRLFARGMAPIEVKAMVAHDSLPEEVTSLATDAWRTDAKNETAGGDQAFWMNSTHLGRSLVLSCPIPDAMFNFTVLQLDLSASSERQLVVYRRSKIPVWRGTFVRKDALVLCTLINNIKQQNGHLLWPWVKFHRAMGFEQIMIYVEEESMDDARNALRGLVEKGAVTLMPFFFGNMSLQKKFRMQAPMEQHIMYRARGHASWVGYCDVDEFFELRNGLRLRDYLELIPANTSGVIAPMQHWGAPSVNSPLPWWRSFKKNIPFPCDLNCQGPPRFFWATPKWIARPDKVNAETPHRITVQQGTLLKADPLMLRLDHLRHCRPNGFCDDLIEPCQLDFDFMDVCIAALESK
mmetsp:Transcript_6165/g.14578  ORF Transcript_6165/g.14578 Transcript_6165/m.14578 type:complete len:444 (+) Transcript_6165:41-1372(+)